MFRPRFWSILFGMTVLALWLWCTLSCVILPQSYLRSCQYTTWACAECLKRDLEDYREKNGNYPETLEVFPKEKCVDGWERSFLAYSVEGRNWQFTTLGADGMPGGEGLDADWVFKNEEFDMLLKTCPTFPQILAHKHTQSCIVYGFLFAICSAFFFYRFVALGKRKLWEKILIFPLLAFCCWGFAFIHLFTQLCGEAH